jgi:cell wall-associated NlpC family hydrolase
MRLRSWLAGAALLAFLLAPRIAAAGSIRTVVDGREIPFDTPPIVENDRTLVPARALLEALGATVTWDGQTRTVKASLNGTEVVAVIGQRTARVDGRPVELDVAPKIVQNRTLIPVRFFAEHLGLTVSWDGETRTVYIDSRNAVASRSGAQAPRRRDTGLAVVEAARKQLGAKYAWAGSSPETGFDCSGLVAYIGSLFGYELPHSSYDLFKMGEPVSKENLRAGDLVFFTTYAEGASHVGIYDGEGGFIHAQSSDTGVKLTQLSNPWWAARYLGARRIFK